MSASIDAYRNVDHGTASSRSVLIRLYSTAEGHLSRAAGLLAEGRDATDALHKAQVIVGGLVSALDLGAGEMAQRFLRLYLFVLDRIDGSHRNRRDTGLAAAREVLGKLREGFEGMSPEDARRTARPLATAAVGLHLKG